MTQLVLYEQARSALAEARRVDEVKDIRDKAEAVRAYARMARDTQLEMDAAELRLRAERRMGILISDMKREGRLHSGGRPKTGANEEPVSKVKLEDLEVDKKLSARCQRVGGIAERAFEAMVARTRQRIADGALRVSLDVSTEDKKAKRAERERELAAKQSALPDKRYGVIYADPEWRFEPYSRDSGMDRAADNHYPTSATDEICRRPVEQIAAADCVLFLWATVPMQQDAFDVMRAWGFEYKSQCIWKKDRIGTGYWFRNAHEILLVGTRGKIPAPAMGDQWPSVIEAPVGKHSEKPDAFYELIESYFPNLPKIELNARRARPGWDAWGNEAPTETVDPETGEIYDAEDGPEDEAASSRGSSPSEADRAEMGADKDHHSQSPVRGPVESVGPLEAVQPSVASEPLSEAVAARNSDRNGDLAADELTIPPFLRRERAEASA